MLTLQSNRLNNHDDQLKEENEEEQHKVSAAVILEGLVCRTIPGTTQY